MPACRPVLLLALVLGLVTGCARQASERLVLAVQPTANPGTLTAESHEIEQFLEARLDGVDVEIRVPTMYAGVVEALRFGNADAAFMSAWPAALANRHAGAEVVLAEVREVLIGEEKLDRPFYYSYWIVTSDSPYRSLDDLEGRRAAFPSPLSTSGYVFPLARLVEAGHVQPGDREADPNTFFGQTTFAGGYAQAWQALKMRQVDVTVIAGDVPEALYREVLGATRIIDQQGPIPSHAVVFGRDLADPLRGRLRDALLELGDEPHRPLMRKFISGIFVRFDETTTGAHLAPLFDALQATRLQFTEGLP
jgi:phosphonate transport system substrate-binding protein